MSYTEISAIEAFELLKKDKSSILIDVRTNEEFDEIGIVDASSFDERMILLPWRINPPLMVANPDFSDSLKQSLRGFFADKAQDSKLIFICRSGSRSADSALHASSLGYKNCFNLLRGFEATDQNKNLQGWKASNLPWRKR